jgi:Ser/Thr protein kinase RdoA (MazF antagonist)
MRESRLRQPFGAINLHAAMRHAGAWLRVYDGIPATGAEHVAHASRADFIDSVNKLAQFLGCALDDSPFFGRIAAETIARLRRALPDELPLGVRHGDYTLRNILVGPGDRVTAIDTLANCRTPIYHDIAYFLMSLKTMRPQVYTQGLAFSTEHLRRYEQAFLAGYFGSDPLPVATIRLFEVQAVLDKWASTVELFGGPRTPIRRIWDPRKWRVEFRLRSRFLRRHVTRLLREMNESC